MWVFNVHLDHLSGHSRRKSVRLIVERVDLLTARGEAVIVLGDFNTFERAPAMRPLFDAGFAHALPASPTGSFHGFSGRTPWPRIDHILTNESLRSLAGELIYHSSDGAYPSDHFPATATLSW